MNQVCAIYVTFSVPPLLPLWDVSRVVVFWGKLGKDGINTGRYMSFILFVFGVCGPVWV